MLLEHISQLNLNVYLAPHPSNLCWFINRAYLIVFMGGAKKPTAANKDKSSTSTKATKKGKKDAGQESGPKKAEIVVKVNGEQALKIVKNTKVITAQDLARHLGVKISATNKFLKNALSEGTVNIIGGYSGHYLYQDAEITKAEKEKRESDLKSKNKKSTPTDKKSDSANGAKTDSAADAATDKTTNAAKEIADTATDKIADASKETATDSTAASNTDTSSENSTQNSD